jgi:hypothetical protein
MQQVTVLSGQAAWEHGSLMPGLGLPSVRELVATPKNVRHAYTQADHHTPPRLLLWYLHVCAMMAS